MGRYLLGRGMQAAVVLLVTLTLVFGALRLVGDPVVVMLPPDATQAQVEALRAELRLDRPLPLQFVAFLGAALRGDWGTSYYHGEPAFSLVWERLPKTVELAASSLFLSVAVSVPAGVLAAANRGSWWDRLILLFSLLGVSTPVFWSGLLFIAVFSVNLSWLPPCGGATAAHLVLPSLTLCLHYLALFVRLVRSGMLEVLNEDYVRTAKAKGLPTRVIVFHHALRNALIPFVTVVGLQLGSLLVYTTVVEKVFAWPGMGRLLLQSIETLDYPVIMAYVLFTTLIFTGLNVIVDITYTVLEPQINYQ